MKNSIKTAKVTLRKGKLLLLAAVCIVAVLGVAILIQSIEHDAVQPNESTIYEIISEPTGWENQTVKVRGTLQETPLGIIQPFNYWLFDKQNETTRIGLKWDQDTNLHGKSVTVIGVVRKGYAWVNPNYPGWWTYYIEATSIHQE